jgi:hypothetical protein
VAAILCCSTLVACSDAPPPETVSDLRVELPVSGRVHVKLAPPGVVSPADPARSDEWDIAFEGRSIFTNSGASGAGKAGAFGPLDASAFAGDTAPPVPFLDADKPAGGFRDWYAYEGATAHAIWSRYHVYGVKSGDRLWKLQIVSYYGERDGAPVSALYRLRYAAPGGEACEVKDLDGTQGTSCPDLASGQPAPSGDLCVRART